MSGKYRKASLLAGIATFSLAGCGTDIASLPGADNRAHIAQTIAETGRLTQQQIHAGLFDFTMQQRISAANAPAVLYIEGDGVAWVGRSKPSLDPTPKDPVALRLAAEDMSANVIWAARPCQYSSWTGGGACPKTYWTGGRFAPEVIAAYQKLLDQLKARHALTGFHLVGYSGGGGVTALIAAERDDILSLRTVAGNLDTDLFTSIHDVTPMHASLNPAQHARRLANLPQVHYVGADDDIVPLAVAESWRLKAGATSCLQVNTFAGVDHSGDWTAHWPQPLPTCD